MRSIRLTPMIVVSYDGAAPWLVYDEIKPFRAARTAARSYRVEETR
jgi:hypothetical protein